MGFILPDKVARVLVASFPAGPWQTNCYVLATQPGAECVIVDPGYRAADGIAEIVREQRLKPVAVLTTHGHLDHMFSVTPVCDSYAMPCWIHPDDRFLLDDPLRGMGPESTELLRQLTGGTATFAEPEDVRELGHGALVDVAGLTFGVRHAPGHTAGSVMFDTDYPDDERVDRLVFSGDVVFAGSIGRTDLPGGDDRAMRRSLRDQVLTLPDASVVLPGHGGQTTIGRERATNPYLRPDYLEAPV